MNKIVPLNISPYRRRNSEPFSPVRKAILFIKDFIFDQVYPVHIRASSWKHWTPVPVAYRAAKFLAEPGARVLDIGSGAGKFCLTGAHAYPESFFFGVEQRQELIMHAENARNKLHLNNAHFICANMTQVNFDEFDHFYFYNSFFENVDTEDPIDDAIATSYSLYTYYTRYLFAILKQRPAGTKLVTYHTLGEEVPACYELVEECYYSLLKMWIKR